MQSVPECAIMKPSSDSTHRANARKRGVIMDFNKIKEMGLEYAEKGRNAAMDLAERGRTQAKIVSEQTKLARAQRQLGALVYSLAKGNEENQPLVDNACTAAEQHAAELTSFPDQMIFVIDHIIEALRADTLMLRFLERSFVWPGLDQIEASGEAEPLMRKVLQIVMCSPEMAGRTEREIYQRITALGSMCISVCYTSVLEGKPDNIDNMKPILYDIIRRAL